MGELLNIITRTSGRPNYFAACRESVCRQTYRNFRHIVGCDDKESLYYLKGLDVILYNKPGGPHQAAHNIYINHLHKEVRAGYILYLDDDDILYSNRSLEIIARAIKGPDDLIFWRVKFPDRLVPDDEYFGYPPKLNHVSGIGFAFHSKYIPHATWVPRYGSDYHVAKSLYGKIKNKTWIDMPLTAIQRTDAGGFGRRDDKISSARHS